MIALLIVFAWIYVCGGILAVIGSEGGNSLSDVIIMLFWPIIVTAAVIVAVYESVWKDRK
jgi:hypothetical protein